MERSQSANHTFMGVFKAVNAAKIHRYIFIFSVSVSEGFAAWRGRVINGYHYLANLCQQPLCVDRDGHSADGRLKDVYQRPSLFVPIVRCSSVCHRRR